MQAAERGRGRDLELSARRRVAPVDKVFGFLDQAQDVDDALEVAFAGFGQGEVAGRALEQAGTKALLEEADTLRYDSG